MFDELADELEMNNILGTVSYYENLTFDPDHRLISFHNLHPILSYLFVIAKPQSSFIFRNRLESNAEHWSALLLSLRELTEWVIRKETELNALAPPKGDLPALLKQQV